MVKIVIKLGVDEDFLNLIKIISKQQQQEKTNKQKSYNLIPYLTEKQCCSPLSNIRIRKECPLSQPLFDIVLEVLISEIRLEKEK